MPILNANLETYLRRSVDRVHSQNLTPPQLATVYTHVENAVNSILTCECPNTEVVNRINLDRTLLMLTERLKRDIAFRIQTNFISLIRHCRVSIYGPFK